MLTLCPFFLAVQLRGSDPGPAGHDHQAAGAGDRLQDHGQGEGLHEGQEEGESTERAPIFTRQLTTDLRSERKKIRPPLLTPLFFVPHTCACLANRRRKAGEFRWGRGEEKDGSHLLRGRTATPKKEAAPIYLHRPVHSVEVVFHGSHFAPSSLFLIHSIYVMLFFSPCYIFQTPI